MPHLRRAHPRTGPIAPLAGYTVAIASDRRRHRLADLLESVGARTVGVQAARSVAKPDPAELRAATDNCLAAPCHELVVSSALGLRAWLAAAGRWGLAERLLAQFRPARLLARDAAAADVLRALGLPEVFSTAGHSTEDLLRFLLAQRPLVGRRVVVQTDRLSLPEVCAAVRRAGAQVVEVPTYTAAPPAELFSLRRLCDLVVRRQVDALALVGAPVTEQLCAQADRELRLPALRQAIRSDVLCAGLGPLTAAPLAEPPGGAAGEAGVAGEASVGAAGEAGMRSAVLVADWPFVEDLAEALLERLPSRALTVTTAGHQLELRGHAVMLDGRLVPVQPGPLAVLRALARRPGQVLSSADIRAAVPDRAGVDDHAVEMAVFRLRQALSGTDLVQTIVKRGYRLAR